MIAGVLDAASFTVCTEWYVPPGGDEEAVRGLCVVVFTWDVAGTVRGLCIVVFTCDITNNKAITTTKDVIRYILFRDIKVPYK